MQAYHNFPFSCLCPPGTNSITLAINDRDSAYDDFLIAPGATPLQPLYHFHYSDKSSDGRYRVTVEHYGQFKRQVATVNFSADQAPEMEFLWLKWNCAFLQADADGQRWASDVGTLEGHDMEFQFMGNYRDGFVTRCLDVEDAYVSVCGIIMTACDTGRIEIPVHVVRDQNGLDEMVTVAMVAMQLQREILWGATEPGEKEKPGKGRKWAAAAAVGAAGVVGGMVSRSSSSSSSSGGKKKKFWGKLKGKT